jgi:mannonate dehydratase
LAVGEIFNTIYDYKDLFEEQLIDYVRSPVSHGGGITPLKKIFDYAAVYQIKSGVHGPTDVSPIGHAASLHLGMAIHNYGISEYMQHSSDTNDVFQPEYTFSDGLIRPGTSPGLGVSYDEKLASQFEYEPAYLPVNRLKIDGTMHDW